jgi:hypothetical protein
VNGDQWFESISLQRRVHCEPDFLGFDGFPGWKRKFADNQS